MSTVNRKFCVNSLKQIKTIFEGNLKFRKCSNSVNNFQSKLITKACFIISHNRLVFTIITVVNLNWNKELTFCASNCRELSISSIYANVNNAEWKGSIMESSKIYDQNRLTGVKVIKSYLTLSSLSAGIVSLVNWLRWRFEYSEFGKFIHF